MLDASVLALGQVRSGKFLIAESRIVGNVIDHSTADRGVERWRLFKIDQIGDSRMRRSSVAQEDA